MLLQLPEAHWFRATACLQNLHFQKSKKVCSKDLSKFHLIQSDILDPDICVYRPYISVHTRSSHDESNPSLEKGNVDSLGVLLLI